MAEVEKEEEETRSKRKRGGEEDLDDYMRELEEEYRQKETKLV